MASGSRPGSCPDPAGQSISYLLDTDVTARSIMTYTSVVKGVCEMVDIDRLGKELHAVMDQVLQRYRAEGLPARGEVLVEREAERGAFTYRWPDGTVEEFWDSRWYRVRGPDGAARVLLAWAQRPAWGREDRPRAIVFEQTAPDGERYYPWTEFVESDDGRYAATIPNPERPRAILREGDPLPSRFDKGEVATTRDLFSSVRRGRSLRFVLSASEEPRMVEHGYWVAGLRGRLHGVE
jgi:hypothetical protein